MAASRSTVVALQDCLAKVLFFGQLEDGLRSRIAADMYERRVSAGEILIQEGDTGLTAAELYIVKEGEFEVRSHFPCPRNPLHCIAEAAMVGAWTARLVRKQHLTEERGALTHCRCTSLTLPPRCCVLVCRVRLLFAACVCTHGCQQTGCCPSVHVAAERRCWSGDRPSTSGST